MFGFLIFIIVERNFLYNSLYVLRERLLKHLCSIRAWVPMSFFLSLSLSLPPSGSLFHFLIVDSGPPGSDPLKDPNTSTVFFISFAVHLCLFFSSSRSLLNISCIFSIYASILFLRFSIITSISLNSFSGRLPISSSCI